MPQKQTLEEFINQANKKHNFKYDYSFSVYNGSKILIEIICKKHGKFLQKPVYHLGGSGCSVCGNIKYCKVNVENCLAILNPRLSIEWHPVLNGSLTPFDVTSCCHEKIWWQCVKNKEHFWQATVNNRNLKEHGCPYCNGNKVCLDNCLATKNPILAKEFDLDANYPLTPFDFTCGTNKNPWWKCFKCEHKWKATVASRNKGIGCPKCKTSKGNKKVAEILNNLKIKYKPEYEIEECKNKRKLPFDFGILDRNKNLLGLIEYQGMQHYLPIKCFGGVEKLENIKKRDLIKFNYCKENNIPLFIISYKDFLKIEELIKEFLKTLNFSI